MDQIQGQIREPIMTRRRWFLRGFTAGILLCAAITSLSYFQRSESWGDLLGGHPNRAEAMGFPVQLWEKGNNYGGYYVYPTGLLINGMTVLLVGSLCGFLTVLFSSRLNRLIRELSQRQNAHKANFQFSIRGLLWLTCLSALALAVCRTMLTPSPRVLGSIYLLGPWILVSIALLPQKIAIEQRAWILTVSAALLIAAAIIVGGALPLPVPFEKVLLGIYICWTPQSASTALLISIAMLVHYRRLLVANESAQ